MDKSKLLSIDYKDWLINQKRLPDKTSDEAQSFFEWHKKLAREGFMMNGEFINPFLYWHLNMWHTEIDVIDELGFISQKYQNPSLRDNEWIITNEIYRANVERKGLAIGGIRRLAKSVLEASYIAQGATFDENSQNVIVGVNAPDIKLITDKLDKGLNNLPWYYQWDRIEDNWGKQVTLGIKEKGGKRYPFSYILIRNLDDGNNEEAIAGTNPKRLIIDEVAKGDFLAALAAATPGLTTQYGWRASPICTFTGGDAKKFNDAKQLFFDCKSMNFLDYPDEDNPKRRHGLFMSNKFRLEAKVPSTLGDYLNNPKLRNIPILVSDADKANEITDRDLEQKKKSNKREIYLKEKMYYPKKVDDIFLNEDTNIFDIEGARRQQIRIRMAEKTGIPVTLFSTETGVSHEFTDRVPISNFPVKPSDDKDAPVIIYEFPIENPPYGLYVAGVDPYRQGKAAYSDSLGTVYIYKRMHALTGEKYQDMFVASYCARPNDKKKWEKQAELLIQMYNARTLCENDEMSFIEHMKSVNKSHYLEKQPDWLKEIVPNTTVSRDFGIHRSAQKIIDFLHGCWKRYTEEELVLEKDENGNITKQILGMHRVLDPMLLEETIQYNEEGNFDRLIAAELALALAYKMDPIFGKATSEPSRTIKKVKVKKPLFTESRGMFIKRKGKLFV